MQQAMHYAESKVIREKDTKDFLLGLMFVISLFLVLSSLTSLANFSRTHEWYRQVTPHFNLTLHYMRLFGD